jgi:hypothetical protein
MNVAAAAAVVHCYDVLAVVLVVIAVLCITKSLCTMLLQPVEHSVQP